MRVMQEIEEGFKKALKSQDKVSLSALRMLRSALKNKEVEKRRKLEEPEILSVVKGLIRQGKESIEQFEKGNRPDLAEKETAELAIIEKYLPVMMSLEETTAAVDRILAGLADKSNAGLVMKAVMQEMKGKADGKMVSELVKAKLS